MKRLERWQQFPWYLWLVGSYPIGYLYAQNISQVDPGTVMIVWAATMLIISAAFFALRALLRDDSRAAAIVVVATAGFFLYGHLYNLLAKQVDQLPSHPVLITVFGMLLLGLMALAWRYHKTVKSMTGYLNIVGLVLVIFPAVSILSFQIQRAEGVELALPAAISPTYTNPEAFPDIYYLVMDMYGRDDWHLDQFDFDNSAFTDALRERGFYIAERSCTNYNTTVTSVSSSLAMNYHDISGLEDMNRREGESYLVTFAQVNNQAAEIAQRLGYTYIHFSSGFLITNRNEDADRVIDFGPDGSFTAQGDFKVSFLDVFLPTTMLRPVYTYVPSRTYTRYAPERVLAQFDELRTIPAMDEPTFTVAHFLSPHFPFTFDREGNRVSKPAGWVPEDDITAPDRYDLYVEQLIYINSRLLETVDSLLNYAEEHDQPRPIILIQGDHNWGNDNDYGFPILNSYLVPAETEAALYPNITPVNSFRLLYDTYWGLDLGLLEQRHYYHLDKNHPFHIRPANEQELAWCD